MVAELSSRFIAAIGCARRQQRPAAAAADHEAIVGRWEQLVISYKRLARLRRLWHVIGVHLAEVKR
jgi:hypothetical protein